MKIDHLNIQDSNIWRISKTGQKFALAAVLSLSLAGSVCGIGHIKNSQDESREQMEAMVDEIEISNERRVSIQHINDLNLILCDSDCDPKIYNTTVHKLEDMGINVTPAVKGDEVLARENSTIITMAGLIYDSDSTVILGPYNNESNKRSDILALAMRAGLKQEGIKVDGIRCGVLKVEKEQDITHRVPTATEEAIAPSGSFVSIAIGNRISPQEADSISDGIINGITRATYQIGLEPQEDYIFRIIPNQTTDGIAEQLHVNKETLIKTNDHLKSDLIQVGDTVIHPRAFKEKAFDTDVSFNVLQKGVRMQTK